MADIYIDPSAATNGTGTAISPRNTWVGVPVAAGNKYYQKRGTTFTGSFPSLTSGTVGNLTTVAAYANTDGSDNPTLAKPIINIGDSIMPGTANSPKTFMKWLNVDIRNSRSLVESDKPIMWLGSDTELNNCNLTTNLTALYGEKASRVTIDSCTITACTSIGDVSMNAIVITGGADMDGNRIISNNIKVGEGGNLTGHVIKCEPYSGYTQTNLQISGNIIRPLNNKMSTFARRGISVNNCTGGEIAYNNVALFHAGFFATGLSKNVWIHHNSFNNNGAFGIHITTNTSNFLIEWNTCNQNGGSYEWANWYGRGIELSAGSEEYKCHAHVIRFNKCNGSYNYGGPADNATEGVGIGLDDGTSACLVYGNIMKDNEGNGLQLYGGDTPPADTGGHIICNNFFINNATKSVRNRRNSNPDYLTDGACHLGLGATRGSKTIIANNLFNGSYGGIRDNSLCDNLEIYNNVFQNQTGYCVATRGLTYKNATGGTYFDSTGALKRSTPGAQRITYNPANLAAAPIPMIEPEVTNICTYSGDLGFGGYGKARLQFLEYRTVNGPDGQTKSLPYYTPTTVNDSHYINREIAGTYTNGELYTSTLIVKVTGITHLWLYHYYAVAGGSGKVSQFDLTATKCVSTQNTDARIYSLSNGWFLISITDVVDSAATEPSRLLSRLIIPNVGNTNIYYPGDPSMEFTVWGWMVNKGGYSSFVESISDIKTTRAADLPEIHNNIYKPSLAKVVANLTTDANGVPSPAQLSAGMPGDSTADPKLDSKYQPTVGSPLLNVNSRNGIPWFMMPVPL